MVRYQMTLLFLIAMTFGASVQENPLQYLCLPCVNFATTELTELEGYIENTGIDQGCDEVCGIISSGLKKYACQTVCDQVGKEDFNKAILDADLDEIYFCQLIDVCSYGTGGAAEVLATQVIPPSGPRGTVFVVNFVFNVTQETYTGMIDSTIYPPRGSDIVADILNEGYQVGVYGARFELDSSSDSPYFYEGTYNGTTSICNGMCGSTHPYSKILTKSTFSFEVTSN